MEKRLDLKNVTLICFDGRPEDKNRTSRYRPILEYITSHVDFYEIKIFLNFDFVFDGVTVEKIDSTSIIEYSNFCIKKLNSHVSSDYCLIFQDDGFILNPDLWDNEFFNYDYIGAPWPLYIGWPKEGLQVGNGGFSLRSKKFLELSSRLSETTTNEDTYLIGQNRGYMENNGVKIAPLDIARKFAIEFHLDKDHTIESCFGFHGKSQLEGALKYIKEKKI